MSLVAVGLSHHTSPVEIRERLGFPAHTLPGALLHLSKRLDKAGTVILSTCNRVEIYVHYAGEAAVARDEIRAFLEEWHKLPEEEFKDALYEHEGRDAVGHLFRVASGLDSLVIGETQILGQVHDAYIAAQTEQTADKVIHNLFQSAFTVAKQVRSQTAVGEGRVSVSSVAVDLAASIFGNLTGKAVMVIGSGEMGELTLKSLLAHGVQSVFVVNRHPERAQALAEQYNGEALPFETLGDHLHKADIIISTTAAPRTILHADHVYQALKLRQQAPLLVIDIAVPRDVDADVGDLDNVYLYNIDDLEQVVNENIEVRRREIEQCLAITERGVDQFMNWMGSLIVAPTITSMAKELEIIRERETQKTLAALPDLTEKQRYEIEYLTKRIVNNILKRPMTEIKHEVGHHDPGTVVHLVKRLFGIEESM
ncbi:MAG TPA: glutamyl-tRNA reductase [Candidatus Hydrogenedentes bacterium]|nr:glutamyl-tRNA reductase [Candidatus Hydrogenedentota bacterium]